MTLSDMAREIERRRPGTLPKSIYFTCINELAHKDNRGIPCCVNDDLAHAILRDAMVMATGATRMIRGRGGWMLSSTIYLDSDHGGCPTRSLFAAFCEAFPEDK